MLVKRFTFKRYNDNGGFQWTAESEIERPGFHRGFHAVGKTLADVKEFAAFRPRTNAWWRCVRRRGRSGRAEPANRGVVKAVAVAGVACPTGAGRSDSGACVRCGGAFQRCCACSGIDVPFSRKPFSTKLCFIKGKAKTNL
jgi:hypothetical protein